VEPPKRMTIGLTLFATLDIRHRINLTPSHSATHP